jgi:hypothetical protein
MSSITDLPARARSAGHVMTRSLTHVVQKDAPEIEIDNFWGDPASADRPCRRNFRFQESSISPISIDISGTGLSARSG